MTEIVLFHHLLGLTPGVEAFADQLRAAGHIVHTPDQLEGKTFDAYDAALGNAKEIGFDTITQRALTSAESLPQRVVYAGFSMGAMAAQGLLQTSAEALGGVLLHGFGAPKLLPGQWPDSIPVQYHTMDADPFALEDGDIVAAEEVASSHTNLECFLYPGTSHLFTDSSRPEYDAKATGQVLTHVLEFLERID
ncbi:MAG: dienelactone hydrolase family protein [Propionibacteriaceae bacterium]|nr:dienelactone hydrolase family protein [Propionibacteriaceae bacterium]